MEFILTMDFTSFIFACISHANRSYTSFTNSYMMISYNSSREKLPACLKVIEAAEFFFLNLCSTNRLPV